MFRSDGLAILNAFRTKEGRKALLGALIAVFGMGIGALPLLGRLVNSERVATAIAAGDPGTFLALASLFVVMPVLVAVAIAIPNVQQELFKGPRTVFLYSAPVSSFFLVMHTCGRAVFSCVFVMSALALPSVVYVVTNTETSAAMLAAVPLAHLALAIFIVGFVILGQVIRARFFSGRVIRMLLQWIGILAALGLVLAGVAGLFAGTKSIMRFGGGLGNNDFISAVLGGPIGWVASSMGGGWPIEGIGRTVAVAACAVPCVLLAAWPLRRAYDRVLTSPIASVGGAVLGGRRVWATTPVRSLARKDFVGLIQERSGVVFTIFFVVMQLVVLKTQLYRVRPDGGGIVLVQHVRCMLMCMHGVLAIFTGIHCLGLAGGEQKQLPILATAPMGVRDFVRGKLFLVVFLFALSVVSIALGAMPLAGAPLEAVLVFLPVGLAVLLFLSGICLAFGTMPSLLLVDPTVPLANSMQTIVPSLVATGGVVGSMIGTQLAIKEIERGYDLPAQMSEAITHGSIAIGVALVIGAGVFAAGYALATRNVRVALRPGER